MNAKEKLIKLMESKEEILEKVFKIRKGLYFNEADRKAIEKWTEEEAEEILKKIIHNIKTNDRAKGLSSYICPFCIKHEDICLNCEYGEHHGVCYHPGSDFKYVLTKVGLLNDKIFDKEWYLKQLDQEDGHENK